MPRPIIDTESSRPRYIRRIILTIVVVVLILAALAYAAFTLWGRSHPAAHALSRNVILAACILGTDHVKESPCFDA